MKWNLGLPAVACPEPGLNTPSLLHKTAPMAPRHQLLLPLAAVLSLAPCVQLGSAEVKAEPIRFNRDIRPILAENCFACHGPDSGARKADLRLDRAATTAAWRPAPSCRASPTTSRADRSGSSAEDPSEVMPPPESHKKLEPAPEGSPRSGGSRQGAEYEPHWSFIAPTRPDAARR